MATVSVYVGFQADIGLRYCEIMIGKPWKCPERSVYLTNSRRFFGFQSLSSNREGRCREGRCCGLRAYRKEMPLRRKSSLRSLFQKGPDRDLPDRSYQGYCPNLNLASFISYES